MHPSAVSTSLNLYGGVGRLELIPVEQEEAGCQFHIRADMRWHKIIHASHLAVKSDLHDSGKHLEETLADSEGWRKLRAQNGSAPAHRPTNEGGFKIQQDRLRKKCTPAFCLED